MQANMGANPPVPTEQTITAKQIQTLLLQTAQDQDLPRGKMVLAAADEMMAARVAIWQTCVGSRTRRPILNRHCSICAFVLRQPPPPLPHDPQRLRRLCSQGDPKTALGTMGGGRATGPNFLQKALGSWPTCSQRWTSRCSGQHQCSTTSVLLIKTQNEEAE